MSYKFSQKLIEETIQCFKDENDLDISQEQADEYLDSLADLYLVFAEKRPAPFSLESGGSLSAN